MGKQLHASLKAISLKNPHDALHFEEGEVGGALNGFGASIVCSLGE